MAYLHDEAVFVEALDDVLVPLGFTRRSRSREWSRRDGDMTSWVHVNFGKVVVNPSLGVIYEDLKRRWKVIEGVSFGTMTMLARLFLPPRDYSRATDPQQIAADFRDAGVRELCEHGNKAMVVERLQSDSVQEWPVPSLSHRIRLLPLLLVEVVGPSEALRTAQDFAVRYARYDQILPTYSEYLEALRRLTDG